jgi:Holliday junction resolvase-like predicted endonuclease
LFTSQWGKLVESLVEGDLIKLLNKREIQVESIIPRRRGNKNGQNYEFDLIAINGTEMVIVEVKTTLRPDDIDDFHKKLLKAKTYMPEYHDKIIYGAVAFITAEGASDRMAEKQGFFVIRASGNSSFIINQDDFKPKAF